MHGSPFRIGHAPPYPPPGPALLLLREAPGRPARAVQGRTEEDAQDAGRRLLCRGCRAPITLETLRITVQGQHEHVLVNPAGYVYQVGCFSAAPGCSHEGAPSWEFTWFPGHTWQIAVCRACDALMGWRFRTPSGDGFHGLILTHLVEDDGKQ
ncbi:cereblon family protein [Desulfocurvus sp. DL9XJH121]